jgi:hypothetical protein
LGFAANGAVVATLTTNLFKLSSGTGAIQIGLNGLSFPGLGGLRIDDVDTGTGLTFSQALFLGDHTIIVPDADGTMVLSAASQNTYKQNTYYSYHC